MRAYNVNINLTIKKSSVHDKELILLSLEVCLPDYPADCFEFVALPLLELVLDPLNDLGRVGALMHESPLNARVDLFLNVLREVTHLAAVHDKDLNLRGVCDLPID